MGGSNVSTSKLLTPPTSCIKAIDSTPIQHQYKSLVKRGMLDFDQYTSCSVQLWLTHYMLLSLPLCRMRINCGMPTTWSSSCWWVQWEDCWELSSTASTSLSPSTGWSTSIEDSVADFGGMQLHVQCCIYICGGFWRWMTEGLPMWCMFCNLATFDYQGVPPFFGPSQYVVLYT